MPAITVKCDSCGFETDDFTRNEDGVYLCMKCDLEDRIAENRHRYQQIKEWLDSTWLEELAKLDRELVGLNFHLAAITPVLNKIAE